MQRKTYIENAVLYEGTADKALDANIKNIIADKQVLARIVKYSGDNFAEYSIDDIIRGFGDIICGVEPLDDMVLAAVKNEDTVDKSLSEGVIYFDVRTTLRLKATGKVYEILINVEAQRSIDSSKLGYHIENRMVYYLARMISHEKGRNFVNSNYDDIKPCRSIWICVVAEEEDTGIEEFTLTKTVIHGKESSIICPDLIAGTIIRVHQADEINTSKNKLISMLEILIARNVDSQVVLTKLKDDFDFIISDNIKREVLEMCNISQAIREDSFELGRKQGIEQAQQVERENAKKEAQASAEKMFGYKMTYEQVRYCISPERLSDEELLEIEQKVRKK